MTVGQFFTKIGNLLKTYRHSCTYIVIVQHLLILKIFKHAQGGGAFFRGHSVYVDVPA